MECYKCGGTELVKNGHHHGKQRYKCKKCGCQFVELNEKQDKSDITKSLAISLYLMGVPYKSVNSIVKEGYDNMQILNWVSAHNFKARYSDFDNVPRKQFDPSKESLLEYQKRDMERIQRNRRDTDKLKKIYSVPVDYGTPNEREGEFVRELAKIIEYMNHSKSKSVKRFVMFELHRYSGEVTKMMYTP